MMTEALDMNVNVRFLRHLPQIHGIVVMQSMTTTVHEKVLVHLTARRPIRTEMVRKRRILIRSLKMIETHIPTLLRRVTAMSRMMISIGLTEGITETVNVETVPVDVAGTVTTDAVTGLTGDLGSQVLVAVMWDLPDVVVLSMMTADEAVVVMIVIDHSEMTVVTGIADSEMIDGMTTVIVEAILITATAIGITEVVK